MKSIEERAYEFACKNDKPSSFFCDLEKSYKVGATEQKAIDDPELDEARRQRDAYYDELQKLRAEKVGWMDKAIQYLDARLRELKQEIREGYDITRPKELIDFKKAMEEI